MLSVAFVGMTHLGLTSSAVCAAKGFTTLCYDEDEELISDLKECRPRVQEPHLEDYMKRNSDRIQYTSLLDDIVGADLIFISKDVDTDEFGNSDLDPIARALDSLVDVVKCDSCVIVLCQVSPGFTRKFQHKFKNLYYQVETLVFGNAIERAENPERIIIGTRHGGSISYPQYQKYLVQYGCPLYVMNYESAELCKTAINLYLAATVSTTNSLSALCERIDADWHEIIPALKSDRRIGNYAYLQPGMGLSGGNIERDIRTVTTLAEANACSSSIFDAYSLYSTFRKSWMYHAAKKAISFASNTKVCIWGLSYKENTNSTKNSPALKLIEQLPDCLTNVYDPVAILQEVHSNIAVFQDPTEAAIGCDVLFVATPWQEFSSVDYLNVISAMRQKIIIDPHRIFPTDLQNELDFYACFGKPPKIR